MDKGTVVETETIRVFVPIAAIKEGHFLLGRYNVDTGVLNDLRVLSNRGTVPPSKDINRYALIGMGDNLPGQPLDDFVEEHCSGWDGVTPINLFFNRADGTYARWEATGIAKAAG